MFEELTEIVLKLFYIEGLNISGDLHRCTSSQ